MSAVQQPRTPVAKARAPDQSPTATGMTGGGALGGCFRLDIGTPILGGSRRGCRVLSRLGYDVAHIVSVSTRLLQPVRTPLMLAHSPAIVERRLRQPCHIHTNFCLTSQELLLELRQGLQHQRVASVLGALSFGQATKRECAQFCGSALISTQRQRSPLPAALFRSARRPAPRQRTRHRCAPRQTFPYAGRLNATTFPPARSPSR